METVRLRHASGATAQIHDYAAHVSSWRTADGVERLFLSERAEFKAGVAIRGGVPIIFPQFAALGPYAKHGFARNQAWQPLPQTVSDAASWQLLDHDGTRVLWPFRFAATYHVQLAAESLQLTLQVRNTDQQPWSFTAALHTYLRVPDIARVTVQGLHRLHYRDSANHDAAGQQQDELLPIVGEVDRIYSDTVAPITVNTGSGRFVCSAEGFADTVIWNPGADKAAALADMEAHGHLRMLCVEAAAIGTPVQLEPGQTWQGTQRLQWLNANA